MTEIPLTRGMVALVDDEDVEKIAGSRWFAHRSNSGWYARSCTRRKVRMHRVIVGAEAGQLVDHRNGDTLDNRRANLRIADAAESAWNQGPRNGRAFKGIKATRRGTYEASLTCRGKAQHLGTFSSPEAAARAYDVRALEEHGEFAHLNFPLRARAEPSPALPFPPVWARPGVDGSAGSPRGGRGSSGGEPTQ